MSYHSAFGSQRQMLGPIQGLGGFGDFVSGLGKRAAYWGGASAATVGGFVAGGPVGAGAAYYGYQSTVPYPDQAKPPPFDPNELDPVTMGPPCSLSSPKTCCNPVNIRAQAGGTSLVFCESGEIVQVDATHEIQRFEAGVAEGLFNLGKSVAKDNAAKKVKAELAASSAAQEAGIAKAQDQLDTMSSDSSGRTVAVLVAAAAVGGFVWWRIRR